MDDNANLRLPPVLQRLHESTVTIDFSMGSEPLVGSLLRTLAASKPGGSFLELGTGTGLGTAWLLAGMDRTARLITVDNDARLVEIAQQHLGHDPRVQFHVDDGGHFLISLASSRFDLIFADTWPGKYTHLQEALQLLAPGGMYVIDDMLPQTSWPEDHAVKVEQLIAHVEQRDDLVLTKMNWASGVIIATKRSG